MTTMLRLIRGEIRKLTTTKLPWGFLAVLVVIAGLDAAVVAFGTDMDGSKTFVATAADQQSLMAFAFNAMMGTSLFGAIAVAREYGHHTVVPMFLTSPNRTRAVLAQLIAVLVGGAVLALIGQVLVVVGVALALPSTDYGFLVSAGDLARLFAATTLAGAIGATLGAGLGRPHPQHRWRRHHRRPGALRDPASRRPAVQRRGVLDPDVTVRRHLRGQPRRQPVGRPAGHRGVGTGPGCRRTRGRPQARRRVRAACAEESQPLPTSRSCQGQPGSVSSVSSVRAIRSS